MSTSHAAIPDQPTNSSTSLLPKFIGLSIPLFYTLFTLLPNSNSMMVKWPWVFIWQVGLMLGPVMLLIQLWQRRFRRLGGWADTLILSWCAALLLSTAFSPFSNQAFWYSGAAICTLSFLYVLRSWITSADRAKLLVYGQASLAAIFSIVSLLGWYFQTIVPFFAESKELAALGIERNFDLQELTLRNWFPLGHQNYVAGYLVLMLPLLIGLTVHSKRKQRYAWLFASLISLCTLYSTASRASWLALAAATFVFIGLASWIYPKLRKGLIVTGGVSILIFALWGATNPRIRGLVHALFNQGEGGEVSYRLITNATGWFMGLDHPVFGAGLGTVTLLYQKYRPEWAGREAELTYQLHSTPAQLWAELGGVGIVLTLLSIGFVGYAAWRVCCDRRTKPSEYRTSTNPTTPPSSIPTLWIIGIISGLVAYLVYAITDFQLDNICISGALILFTSILWYEYTTSVQETKKTDRHQSQWTRKIALVGTSLVVAFAVWLYPVHRAWMFSSQGFLALQNEDVPTFVASLEKANELAPWEPYYAYQLGWNLGEMAFNSTDPQQQESLRQEAVKWFERAIALSPYREFGYSNLGWLQINADPTAATENFRQAVQLVPGKLGSDFSLGYSHVKAGNEESAFQSFISEFTKDPAFITSPVWRSPELSRAYPGLLDRYEAHLQERLSNTDDQAKEISLKQRLGSLNWWQSDFSQARTYFIDLDLPLNQAMYSAAVSAPGEKLDIDVNQLEELTKLILLAWQDVDNRFSYFEQALSLLPSLMTPSQQSSRASELSQTQAMSSSFHEWLTQNAASFSKRNQRLGFNVMSRHIDGSIPSDYHTQQFNFSANVLFKAFWGCLSDSV